MKCRYGGCLPRDEAEVEPVGRASARSLDRYDAIVCGTGKGPDRDQQEPLLSLRRAHGGHVQAPGEHSIRRSRHPLCGIACTEGRFSVSARCVPVHPLAVMAHRNASIRTGLEHIELVIGESFESFMTRNSHLKFDTKVRMAHPPHNHKRIETKADQAMGKALNPDIQLAFPPHGTVKFHHMPLEQVIVLEKEAIDTEAKL